MKKIVILFALLIASINANSQSVLGIPFGSSYDTVLVSLNERFGTEYVCEDGGDILVLDASLGGFDFNSGKFFFQRIGNKSYLYFANFERRFGTSETEDAKKERDYLFSLLKDKYAGDYISEYKNEQGFKCYQFGTNPKDKNMSLGCIYLMRGKGGDGKSRLYLELEYGPIYYVDKAADF